MSVTLKSVPRTSQARGSKSGRILVGERVADIALAMAKSKGIRLRDLVESALRYYAAAECPEWLTKPKKKVK